MHIPMKVTQKSGEDVLHLHGCTIGYDKPLLSIGGAVSGRSARTSVSMVAGRGTVWRNIFGSDPDKYRPDDRGGPGDAPRQRATRRECHTSRIRTADLGEFTNTIAASDQAGGGVRYVVTPAIQVIGDGSVVWSRRDGRDTAGGAGRFRAGGPPLAAQPPAGLQVRRVAVLARRLAHAHRRRCPIGRERFAGWRAGPGEARCGRVRRVGSRASQNLRSERGVRPRGMRSRAATGRASSPEASGRRWADGRRVCVSAVESGDQDLEVRVRTDGQRRKRHRRHGARTGRRRSAADGRLPRGWRERSSVTSASRSGS